MLDSQGACRFAKLDSVGVRSSTSYGRGEAHLLYEVHRAAATTCNMERVRECAAEPLFVALLRKTQSVRNAADGRPSPKGGARGSSGAGTSEGCGWILDAVRAKLGTVELLRKGLEETGSTYTRLRDRIRELRAGGCGRWRA